MLPNVTEIPGLSGVLFFKSVDCASRASQSVLSDDWSNHQGLSVNLRRWIGNSEMDSAIQVASIAFINDKVLEHSEPHVAQTVYRREIIQNLGSDPGSGIGVVQSKRRKQDRGSLVGHAN
jgi:hypothetical protein